MKILLWAVRGSGEFYNGTATYSHRLYQAIKANANHKVSVDLAHGNTMQGRVPTFDEQYLISKWSPRILRHYTFLHAAKKWIRANATRYSVLHAITGYHCSLLPALWAQQCGLPAVVWIGNHLGDLGSKKGVKRLLGLSAKRQELIRNVAAVVAMSDEIVAELQSYGVSSNRIFCIPNSVDTIRFRPPASHKEKTDLRATLGLSTTLPIVVFSGELSRRKQPHLILQSLGLAQERGWLFQVAFVGPTPDAHYRREMDSLIRELGLPSNAVVFAGYRDDVENWLRAGDVFCLPSLNEGMPAAAIEALATGLPLVLTPFSSAGNLVDTDHVGRIASGNAEGLFEAIAAILRSEDECAKMRHACRALATARFGARAVALAHLELFASLKRD